MYKNKFKEKFNKKTKSLKSVWFTFLGNLFFVYCLVACLGLILFSTVTIECRVTGSSMQPTLNGVDENKQDYVYVNTKNKDYNYGDVIVINVVWDNEPIIKRIIGMPGDKIDIVFVDNEYKLERNGEIIEEEYIYIDRDPDTPTKMKNGMAKTRERLLGLKDSNPELFEDGKYIVEDNEVFVLGDHRQVSIDSSKWGAFSLEDIVGKVENIRYYGDCIFTFYWNYIVKGEFIHTLVNCF